MEQSSSQAARPSTTRPTFSNLPSSTTISLRNLATYATLGLDAWSRSDKSQPIFLSIYLSLPISLPVSGPSVPFNHDDTLATSFNYSTLAKDLTTRVQGQSFTGLEHLTQGIASVAITWPGRRLRIEVRAPKALVRGEGLERIVWMHRDEHEVTAGTGTEGGAGARWIMLKQEYILPSLRLACIIGLNPHERLEKQDVVYKIRFLMSNYGYTGKGLLNPLSPDEPPSTLRIEAAQQGSEKEVPWQSLVRSLIGRIEVTAFQTIEALAAEIADWVLEEGTQIQVDRHDTVESTGSQNGMKGLITLHSVSVAVEKPSALAFVEGAGVEVVSAKGGPWMIEDD